MNPNSIVPLSDDGTDSLGGLLRSERERQGLSLRQLGRLVGVDASAILLWERNETIPKAKYLAALSRMLEVSTRDLMTLSGAEYPNDAPTLPVMLRAEYDLPPEAVAEIERHIARVAKKYGATKKSDPSSTSSEAAATATTRTSKSSSHERRTP